MAKRKQLFDEEELRIDATNSGATELAKMKMIDEIKVHPSFQNLFSIDDDLVAEIAENIKINGYDKSQPIHIWKEQNIPIDGHTRLAAAKTAGMFEIPVYEHSFPDERSALLYAYSLQLNRRNLSDADLVSAVQKYIELGGKTKKGRLREILAAKTGTSPATIARVMAVAKNTEASNAIKTGKSSVNEEYKKLMGKKHPESKKSTNIPPSSSITVDATTIKDTSVNDTDETAPTEFDDISESISSLEDTPAALNFSHTDGKERPAIKPNDVPDFEGKVIKARQESYQEGYDDGYREGAGEFGEKLFCYALSEASKGRTPEEIYQDITDFSGSELIKFQLSEENEAIIQSWEVE